MKTIILGLLLSGSICSAGPLLLKATTFIGFSPTPGMRTLTIDTDGKVEYQGPDATPRGGGGVKRLLAQLSSSAVSKLKNDVAVLNPRTPLRDENPDGPYCMDGPTVNMYAYTDVAETRFYTYDGCHTFRMEDGSGYELTELLNGLEHLTN
jgi:hypothetical protein